MITKEAKRKLVDDIGYELLRANNPNEVRALTLLLNGVYRAEVK